MDNVTDQLQRLTTQLKVQRTQRPKTTLGSLSYAASVRLCVHQDLDEFRSELDDEEYTYLKAETERQLKVQTKSSPHAWHVEGHTNVSGPHWHFAAVV